MKTPAVLVTGASGLLGATVVKRLSSRFETYAVVRTTPQRHLRDVNYILADLRRTRDYERLPRKIDHVVHLAQSRRYAEIPEGSTDIVEVNAQSTASMLNYAQESGAQSFLFASSGGIYRPSFEAKTEESPLRQVEEMTPYFGSKIFGEALANAYKGFFFVKTLRFFFIYSPEQTGTGLVGRLRAQLSNEQPIQLAGDGPLMNPIHVSDAARAVERGILHSGSFVANIAGNEILSLRSLVELISRSINVEATFESQGQPTESLVGDCSRMHSLLATPRLSLTEAFPPDRFGSSERQQ